MSSEEGPLQGRVLCVEPVESIFNAMRQNIRSHADWCAAQGEAESSDAISKCF